MTGPGSKSNLADGLALVFDMDGVLLDSVPAHREAWAAYNRGFGLETTEEMFLGMHGRRNDQIIRDLYPNLAEEEVARRCADKERLYRSMIAPRLQGMLVPGLRPFLESYRQAPLALATNAERENVSFLLDNAGLRGFFQVALDGDQVERPKPDPEIYLRAAELLGVAPENTIVFEDSSYGVEAARKAGARVIGLSTTYVNLPGTAICIDNFLNRELYSWLATQKCVV